MGKLENKRDLSPYRQLRTRIDSISQDGRYAFMFGSLTVYDGMTQVLSRIFRVPVNNKPITIVELTGLPTEIINVVVSVLARMTFDFAHWSEGKVPLTLVCEEAHRYVPAIRPSRLRAVQTRHRQDRQGGPQVRRCAVHRLAASLPRSIRRSCPSATPCSRCACRTIATRRSSPRRSPTRARACWSSCPRSASARRSPSATASPCRCASSSTSCRRNCLPRSTTARFTEHWQRSVGDEGFLEQVVEKWRTSDISAGGELGHHPAFIGDPLPPTRSQRRRRSRRVMPTAAEPDLPRPVPRDARAPAHGYGARPAACNRHGRPPACARTAPSRQRRPRRRSRTRMCRARR